MFRYALLASFVSNEVDSLTILNLHSQNPTRKMFMLATLEPSVVVTGGPWYTDKELDTEFISTLCTACLRFISEKVRRVIM
jgi:hypothetical protein